MLFLGVPCEETPEGSEDRSSECLLGRGTGKCKGPEALWRSGKECVAEVAKDSGKKRGGRVS